MKYGPFVMITTLLGEQDTPCMISLDDYLACTSPIQHYNYIINFTYVRIYSDNNFIFNNVFHDGTPNGTSGEE